MSTIIDTLVDAISSDAMVREVQILPRGTIVETDRGAGLASSFFERAIDAGEAMPDVAVLCGRPVQEVAALARSSSFLEASVGVAAMNAVVAPTPDAIERNAFDLLCEWGAGKRVVVVGHFPFVERLRSVAADLKILELIPAPGDLPAEEAPRIIPAADVVAITGTTLINHTIDGLLDLAREKRVMLLGPSTILSPLLFAFGVDVLCGSHVVDADAVYAHLKAGGCFRRMPGLRQAILLSP